METSLGKEARMLSTKPTNRPTRREFVLRAFPAGAVCAACPGLTRSDLLAQTAGVDQEAHKFLQDAGLTTEQVFQFAYTRTLIPFLRGLGKDRDREEFLEELRGIADVNASEIATGYAKQVPRNDLATFTAPFRDPASPGAKALTIEVVEFSDNVCELRVTDVASHAR
jgi:hypothetical protein